MSEFGLPGGLARLAPDRDGPVPGRDGLTPGRDGPGTRESRTPGEPRRVEEPGGTDERIDIDLSEATSNTFQVDLEPWYCNFEMDRWDEYTDYVVRNTRRILDLLAATDNEATFFTLPVVAREYPGLIDRIVDEGHEIASHGWSHTHLSEMTRPEFERELEQSLAAFEAVGVTDVVGYRAPQFSLDHRSNWMLEALEEAGFTYDSSIFPVQTPLFGVPEAPREPYRIDYDTLGYGPASNLVEVPLSTVGFPVRNIPVAGGFFLRSIPYPLLARCYERIEDEGLPLVCYIHPPELDPDVPRPDEYAWHQYVNVDRTEAKLSRLFEDFDFTTTRAMLDA